MFGQEIRDVLAKLSMLSEVSAAGLEPHTSQGKSSSKVPSGVGDEVQRSDPDRPPPKERSLFDWYVWKFQRHQDDPKRLISLLLLAERDYLTRRFHSPDRAALRSGKVDDEDVLIWSCPVCQSVERDWISPQTPLCSHGHAEIEMTKVADGLLAERAAAERICEWYVGLSAIEVAIEEGVTEAWVKKARREHGRNPDDGRPLPEFYGWDEKTRSAKVLLLAETMSQSAAADHLGVDRKSVHRYWPAEAAAVAA